MWWLRQQVQRPGHGRVVPALRVSVQRPGRPRASVHRRPRTAPVVIERGDHLHTDFGIKAMGLATDTQHVGYVLKAGRDGRPRGPAAGPRELEPPAGPPARAHEARPHRQRGAGRHARRDEGGGHRRDRLHASRSATTATAPVRSSACGTGRRPCPAGATCRILPSTWFSIELQATTAVPEWGGQEVRSAQEEDVVVDERRKGRVGARAADPVPPRPVGASPGYARSGSSPINPPRRCGSC